MSGTLSARILLLIGALTGAGVAPALGQTRTTARPGVDPGAMLPATTVEFADEPFRLDAVGLSMQVPLNSQVKATRGAGVNVVGIEASDKSWLINVTTRQTTNPGVTIKDAMEKTIEQVKFSVGVTDRNLDRVVETQAQVIDQVDSLTINGQEAGRVYISLPTGEGKTRVVKGFTFFKPSPRQFVVFELNVPGQSFNRVRGLYETVLATATFADPSAVMTSYAAAVKAGVRLFEQVDETDFERAMSNGGNAEQFHRLYKPSGSGSPSDATEMGYRSLRFWRGARGEVDPDARASDWKGVDKDAGYLCQLTVRLLEGSNVIDTVARYFMTPDRQGESWSVVMVRTDQQGREIGRWRETGARSGKDMRVSVTERGSTTRPIEPFIQGEGYLSQFEAYLLPSLLIHKAVKDGVEAEFGFYTYRSESEVISLRRDTVARDTQAGGVWTISTKFRDDSKPQRTVFNDKGDMIRTELPDGRVWEPIKVDDLLRLWQRKGLPTKK